MVEPNKVTRIAMGLCDGCPVKAENKRLTALLRRAKKTFEPFPVCSDLRSMTQRLREKRPETEVKAIKKGFAKHQAKFRKLYRDIEHALSGGKDS